MSSKEKYSEIQQTKKNIISNTTTIQFYHINKKKPKNPKEK